jgi:uncharacterized protein YecE (DUF72 family)
LFARGPAAPVDTAPEVRETRVLASALPRHLRLGTSSWSFPGWEGLVYDREARPEILASHGLAAYARHPLLRCVGLDRGYYGPIPRVDLARYRDQTPRDFRFVVKADRRLVFPSGPGADPAKLLDPAWATDVVVAPLAEELGERLGAVLFQLPPVPARAFGGPRSFAESLYRFLRDLPAAVPYAVELRTPALATSDYGQALAHGGASHAYVVHPEMLSLADQLRRIPPRSEGPRVVRWMLQPGWSYSAAREAWSPFGALRAPDPTRRREVADTIRVLAGDGSPVLTVVNNKAEGSSPLSVVALAQLLAVPAVDTKSHATD